MDTFLFWYSIISRVSFDCKHYNKESMINRIKLRYSFTTSKIINNDTSVDVSTNFSLSDLENIVSSSFIIN